MAPRDGLSFSGYLQPPSVPPDPTGEDWRGEPGPPGTPGTPGAEGPPGPPVTDVYNARDFGIVLDGVTDQGAALNAVLASLPLGAHLLIPASVYTTQTIVVELGRVLVMRNSSMRRPSVGSNLLECNCAIIGSASLSPVVLCLGNESSTDGLNVTRNGTPAAGSIGVQCLGQNQIHTRLYSYNHARCIQVGALRSAPVHGLWSAITTRFDHCIIWRGTEDWLYLINAPEVAIYDMRFGINGEVDPTDPTSLVCIDGDLNSAVDAGTTNTINFIRCQFNTGAGPRYIVRFHQYNSPDGQIALLNCYCGGAIDAFIFIDPNCTIVRHLWVTTSTIGPLAAGETFFSDTGHRVNSLELIGNHISGYDQPPIAPFTLSGIGVTGIGNVFSGPFQVKLDAMAGGCWVNNSANTMEFSGAYTGTGSATFIVSGNTAATFIQTATGGINYMQPNAGHDQQMLVGRTSAAGRIGFRRGSDGGVTGYVGHAGGPTGGSITELANMGGSPVVRLNAGNATGLVQFWVNGALVGQSDERGMTIAKAVGSATAPGAGFARLGFVNGTTAGTAKLVAYAGTSTTPTTIVDNIGTGF